MLLPFTILSEKIIYSTTSTSSIKEFNESTDASFDLDLAEQSIPSSLHFFKHSSVHLSVHPISSHIFLHSDFLHFFAQLAESVLQTFLQLEESFFAWQEELSPAAFADSLPILQQAFVSASFVHLILTHLRP